MGRCITLKRHESIQHMRAHLEKPLTRICHTHCEEFNVSAPYPLRSQYIRTNPTVTTALSGSRLNRMTTDVYHTHRWLQWVWFLFYWTSNRWQHNDLTSVGSVRSSWNTIGLIFISYLGGITAKGVVAGFSSSLLPVTFTQITSFSGQ